MTPPQKPTLDAVQGWMQSVITHPRGVEAGVASEAARMHLDVAPAEAGKRYRSLFGAKQHRTTRRLCQAPTMLGSSNAWRRNFRCFAKPSAPRHSRSSRWSISNDIRRTVTRWRSWRQTFPSSWKKQNRPPVQIIRQSIGPSSSSTWRCWSEHSAKCSMAPALKRNKRFRPLNYWRSIPGTGRKPA